MYNSTYEGGFRRVKDYSYLLLVSKGLRWDDGTWKPGVRIATNCFTKEEVELLSLALDSKFNLKSSLHKNNNNYQLYIKQESLPLLKKLVLPYMIPSMLYKLGL